jgi:copper chaperone CopZ
MKRNDQGWPQKLARPCLTPHQGNEENNMQTEIFEVAGMTSEKCIETITRALTGIAGVGDLNVSLLRGEVAVQFDEKRAVKPQLESALVNAGYTVRVAQSAEAGKGSCCGGCCG